MNKNSYDSIVVPSSLTRGEIINCLEQHGIIVDPTQGTGKLRKSLVKTLRKNHPLHLFVRNLPSKDLKAIWNYFCFKGKYQDKAKNRIVNFFFKTYPSKPLETVKSFPTILVLLFNLFDS